MAYSGGSVEIEIKSTADTTEKALSKLTATVKTSVKEMEKMIPVFNSINKFSNGLTRLEKLNLTKLSTQITGVGKAMEQLNNQFKTNPLKDLSSQSIEASNGLNKFANSLKKIEKLQNIDARELYNSMSSLSRVSTAGIDRIATSLNTVSLEKFNQMATGINSYANAMLKLEKINVTGVTSQLQALGTPLNNFFTTLSQNVDISGLESVLKTLKQLPTSMAKMETLDLDAITKSFSTLATQIQPFLSQLKEATAELSYLSTIATKLGGTKLTTLTREVEKLGTKSAKTSKSFSQIFNLGKIYFLINYTKQLGQYFATAISSAAAYSETLNLMQVSMVEYTEEATKFANELSEAFGTALPILMQYQAVFNNMLKAMGGIDTSIAYELSETLTEIALDFSSLFNTSVESAMSAFQSALSQQVRPIRSTSGFDITENTLETYLPGLGIYDRTIRDLSEVEQRILTIIALTKQMQSVGAQGDLAKTINSSSNMLKIMQQQLSEISRWVGSVILAGLNSWLAPLAGALMVVKELIKMLAIFLGYEADMAQVDAGSILGTSDAVDGLGEVEEAVNDVKNATTGIDELNVISPTDTDSDAGVGGIDPRLLAGLEDYDNLLENVENNATKVRDRIMEWLGFTKSVNEETGEIEWIKDNELTNLDKIISGAKLAGQLFLAWRLGVGFLTGIKLVQALFTSSFWTKIVVPAALWIWNIVNAISGMATGSIAATSAFTFLTSWITTSIQAIITAITSTTGLIIGLVLLLIAGMIQQWENFKISIENIFIAIQTIIQSVFNFIGSIIYLFIAIFTGQFDLIPGIVQHIFNSVIGIVNGLIGVLYGVVTAITSAIVGIINVIGGVIVKVVNLVIGMVNGLIGMLNSFLGEFTELGQKLGFDLNFRIGTFNELTFSPVTFEVPKFEIPQYANGGFPQKGTFMMNEGASAEMLGTINGKTAVANNDQIASALASALIPILAPMMQSVVDAIDSNSQQGDVILKVDSREIAKATRTGENKLGQKVTKGGAFTNA